MNPSSGNKYLTPCRTFGLQRTRKRTPGSKGLTPQGGASCSLNAPFRSPLITDSTKWTPSAEKKSSSSLPKPSWSTPLLPKARVKMGLSKPSPKTHPVSLIRSRSLIQTEFGKSELSQRGSCGNKKQVFSNKKDVLGHSNRLHESILQSAQAIKQQPSATSHQSNDEGISNGEGDSKLDQPDDQIVFQPAGELARSAGENPQFSQEIGPPKLSCKKLQILDAFLFSSESDSDERNVEDNVDILKTSSLEDARNKLDNDCSQEPFHGWDLENDKESLDSDAKRDLYQKCVPNLNNELCSSANQPCSASEPTELVPSNISPHTNKSSLSFVKEKFRSKRRLLSDSDDSDDSDDNFSFKRKHFQEPEDCAARVLSGWSENTIGKCTSSKPGRLVLSESDEDSDVRSSEKGVQKSNVPSSPSVAKKSSATDVTPDSEKENCETNNLIVGIRNGLKSKSSSAIEKTKALSKRRVLSDSEDDSDNISEPINPTNKSYVPSSSSAFGNLEPIEDRMSDSTSRLLLDGCNDDTHENPDYLRKPTVRISASEQENVRHIIDEQSGYEESTRKIGNVGPAKSQFAPDKDVLPSNSDHNFIRETSESPLKSCVPVLFTSPKSARTKMGISAESDDDDVDNVKPPVTLENPINGIELARVKPRSGICALSTAAAADDDDDSFFMRRPPKNQPKNEKVIPERSLKAKGDSNSPKVKLVVELRRLPKSAVPGVADEGIENSERNSQSSCKDSTDEDIERFSIPQNNLKTYGRTVLKKEKMKTPGRFSYTKHPSYKSGAKQSSLLAEPLTLLNKGVKPGVVDDEVKRYVECISETEDFERMNSEMQKWLEGGQQVISQIIEEVRLQRDKDMSVMEVLKEHNIDPNLVGYDPAVEEFVSFDKFLLKNNLK